MCFNTALGINLKIVLYIVKHTTLYLRLASTIANLFFIFRIYIFIFNHSIKLGVGTGYSNDISMERFGIDVVVIGYSIRHIKIFIESYTVLYCLV